MCTYTLVTTAPYHMGGKALYEEQGTGVFAIFEEFYKLYRQYISSSIVWQTLPIPS